MTDKKETTLSPKLEKIAQEIEKLTVLEMAELAKYLEDKFGIAPMAMAAAVPAANASQSNQEPKEEKTIFTLVLTETGSNKLAVIKTLREILPNLGLMDAKKMAESAPQEVLKEVKKEQAEDAKKKLEAAGAKVELK